MLVRAELTLGHGQVIELVMPVLIWVAWHNHRLF